MPLRAGHFISRFNIPANIFRPGMYTVGIGARASNSSWVWGSDVAALQFPESSDGRSADRYEGAIGIPFTAQRIQQNVAAAKNADAL